MLESLIGVEAQEYALKIDTKTTFISKFYFLSFDISFNRKRI